MITFFGLCNSIFLFILGVKLIHKHFILFDMKNVIASAFDYASDKCDFSEITPRFIALVNAYIKARFDARYKVKFRAASNYSAIVEYHNRCYYIYYDYCTAHYVGENN